MQRSKIAGIGYYVPQNVYTNEDLKKYMDTSDEWIQERTGIKERRYAGRLGETTTTMGIEASKIAIERAGITPQDIDFIVFATLCPDYHFPGCGVLLQRAMKMKEIGALDVRNQCSGNIGVSQIFVGDDGAILDGALHISQSALNEISTNNLIIGRSGDDSVDNNIRVKNADFSGFASVTLNQKMRTHHYS